MPQQYAEVDNAKGQNFKDAQERRGNRLHGENQAAEGKASAWHADQQPFGREVLQSRLKTFKEDQQPFAQSMMQQNQEQEE